MITEHKDTDLFWITDDFYNLFDTMMEVEVVNAPRFFLQLSTIYHPKCRMNRIMVSGS